MVAVLGTFVGAVAHILLVTAVATLMLLTAGVAVLFTLPCAPPLAWLRQFIIAGSHPFARR
jgi:hypothetical protein